MKMKFDNFCLNLWMWTECENTRIYKDKRKKNGILNTFVFALRHIILDISLFITSYQIPIIIIHTYELNVCKS